MLGQHLRLWINMNPAQGHRSYTGVQSHRPNIGLTLVHRLRRRPKIMKTLGRCRPIRWPNIKSTCQPCVY